MSVTESQNISDRIDAELLAWNAPPVRDEQIAETLASIGAAFPALAIPRTDPVQEARDLVRGALGELGPLNVSLNAYACDDDFGQPNRASIATAKLALALECLSEIGR